MSGPGDGLVDDLFDHLFDDAALFPPGDAPMAAAVPEHRELRARLGRLVGPFVVPAGRLDELVACLGDGPALGVSVIASADDLPDAVARVVAEPGLRLVAVEVPVVADAAGATRAVRTLHAVLPDAVPAAVEVPRTAARDEVLDALAGAPYRAKLRTGGLRAELIPPPDELAATLSACVARGLAVKCTAGLHAAVRRTDPATGVPNHGFLGVLAACEALAGGAPESAAAGLLAGTDPAPLLAAIRSWSADRTARARAVFTSFGTCSVLEPVEDLVGLGLLPARLLPADRAVPA